MMLFNLLGSFLFLTVPATASADCGVGKYNESYPDCRAAALAGPPGSGDGEVGIAEVALGNDPPSPESESGPDELGLPVWLIEAAKDSPAAPGVSAEDLEPLVVIPPTYPSLALTEGIEGFCTVRFTVTSVGFTEGAEAVDCNPADYFERASLDAAALLKYAPPVQNGDPVAVDDVEYTYIFSLPEQ